MSQTDRPAVPFFGHGRLPAASVQRVHDAIAGVLTGSWLAGGNMAVADFETRLATFLDRPRDIVACSSGTAALSTALEMLCPGDPAQYEVVSTSFTYGATVMPAVRRGMAVTVVGVDPGTLLADDRLLADAVHGSRRRPVLIAVHLNGRLHACPEARAAVRERDGVIIDDAAQRMSPSLPADSDAWCFSLGPTKNVMGIGESGAVALDEKHAEAARSFVRNGNAGGMVHRLVGDNLKMDGVAAAVLVRHLDAVAGWDEQRARVAEVYAREFALRGLPDGFQTLEPAADSVHHKQPLLTRSGDRDALVAFLGDEGIEVGTHYPLALPDHPAFKNTVAPVGDLRSARDAAARVITLPIHPWIDHVDVDRVCSSLWRFDAARA